eukprot:3897779-Rhodomonas_salina.1
MGVRRGVQQGGGNSRFLVRVGAQGSHCSGTVPRIALPALRYCRRLSCYGMCSTDVRWPPSTLPDGSGGGVRHRGAAGTSLATLLCAA